LDVSLVRVHRGSLALRRGRADEAVDWYLRAIEADGGALAGRPNDPSVLTSRAEDVKSLARVLNRRGRSAEAVGPLIRTVEELSAALARDPGAGGLKPVLADALRARAEAMARLGRSGEAAEAWSRAEALNPADAEVGLGPAFIAAWSGDPSRALAEVEAYEGRGESTPERLVARARAAAVAAAVAAARRGPADPELAGRCADRAVALLARAAAAGFFEPPGRRASLATDAAWDPLRDRDAFRLLRLDLAFPADPFARGR
jgi:tetratricopeptide (TPR) repeat protein